MLFVGRVGIGVEKTYNDRFHLFRDQVLCGRDKLILIERRDDLSLGGYPLGDFEPLIAGDERAIVPRKGHRDEDGRGVEAPGCRGTLW